MPRLAPGLPILLAVGLITALSACETQPRDPTGRGATAESFVIPSLVDGDLDLDAFRGRPIVLNFWATTCEPCIREMPLLEAAAIEHATDDLVVIGVDYLEDAERVSRFLSESDISISYPIGLDLDGAVGRRYGVAVIPTTFFIDVDGVVQYRRLGEVRDEHFEHGWSRIKASS